jgi:predicted Fe-Mo cluster-binding NifX family protein
MKKFVFVEDVQDLLAQGGKELQVPEGSRLSAAAADLVKEKGVTLVFTAKTAEKPFQGHEREEKQVVAIPPESNAAKGRIAVASEERDTLGRVGNVAARSAYFLIFDEQGQWVETLANPYRSAGGGAGPLVANFLAEKGVIKMVAQSFGVNMRASLQEKRVDHFAFSGSIQEALKAIMKFTPLGDSD